MLFGNIMTLDSKFLQENGFLDDNTGKISLADKLEGKTKQYIDNNMAETKTLTVTITETEERTETRFNTKGLTDFEIVGILSYYLDTYKVKMIREQGRSDRQEDDSKA